MNAVKTGMLLAGMTALFMGVGFLIGGEAGMAIAFIVAIGMNAFAFWNSDKMALRMHNAQQVNRASNRELYDMVALLSRNADLPTPKIFVIHSDQPNAFATGRNPKNSAVAVTTGLMRILNRDEVAAVMAHELAHIKNRDTLIMTMAATLAGAISMLAQFGMFFGSSSDNRNPLGFIGVLLAVIFAPIAAMLVQMLISRTREYAADRMGGEICRNPLALARALQKISSNASAITLPSAERNPGSAHLFIVNPLSGARMDNLFSTHPNPANRIAALKDQARTFGVRSGGAGEAGAPAVTRTPSVKRRKGPWS